MKYKREKPLPDWLNPIFLLSVRRPLGFVWNHPLAVTLFLVLFFFLCQAGCRFFFPGFEQFMNSEDAVLCRRIYLGVISFVIAVFSGSGQEFLAKRTIDRDMYHYTAMSRGRIVFGYFLIGLYRAAWVAVVATYLIFVFFFPHFWPITESIGVFLLAFLVGIALNLFTLSWSAAVHEHLQNVLTSLTFVPLVMGLIFFPCIILSVLANPYHAEVTVAKVVFVIVMDCCILIAVSLSMIKFALSREATFLGKYLSNIAVYGILFVVLGFTTIVILSSGRF